MPVLADRRVVGSRPARAGTRDVQRRTEISQSLRFACGGHSSAHGRIMGQFSPDLFHGRADTLRDAAIAQLGGPILARIVVVSNRVSVPSRDGAKRAGGLEVAL